MRFIDSKTVTLKKPDQLLHPFKQHDERVFEKINNLFVRYLELFFPHPPWQFLMFRFFK